MAALKRRTPVCVLGKGIPAFCRLRLPSPPSVSRLFFGTNAIGSAAVSEAGHREKRGGESSMGSPPSTSKSASRSLSPHATANSHSLGGTVSLKIPEDLRRFYAETTTRRIRFIDSKDAAQKAVASLMEAASVAVDCEGVSLGRFGRLCLLQMATDSEVFLLDTLRDGVVDTVAPVLTSTEILKVMHDCREDSSALFHQHGVELRNVFDTQVAHLMSQGGGTLSSGLSSARSFSSPLSSSSSGDCEGKRDCEEAEREHQAASEKEKERGQAAQQQQPDKYQIGLNELLSSALHVNNRRKNPVATRMLQDPNVWFFRPIKRDLIEYAVADVIHLCPLQRKMEEALGGGDAVREAVVSRSSAWVSYCHLNAFAKRKSDLEKRGLRLQAMLVSASPRCLYFKLNCHKQGVVSRVSDMEAFRDVEIGDTTDCVVSNWNASGSILFLERAQKDLRQTLTQSGCEASNKARGESMTLREARREEEHSWQNDFKTDEHRHGGREQSQSESHEKSTLAVFPPPNPVPSLKIGGGGTLLTQRG
uniref:3'-5' exonuclease domain-containing protein n=1 Tax=Chromera velia CCMP2878 TaxID=1169474 RepID=A0A0G4HYI2_9ALVE|eukprot:Cvel_1544.t1-p1 / transcript=Cvel_1544.t1 / gene=Cvel_1544 / organism=Chromera_velia_CCMP2878 / gene_product=Exonuclease 3'-5' domain-containing protein 1, putative / transcript_product=Exonuclease 3'-5' domain-containing protein 1, putative / location=Cvel_scaffold54:109831-116908(-) / protein_length=533 / sequence_SO=supercontig / SO=protein_coding / is_pseudo=false